MKWFKVPELFDADKPFIKKVSVNGYNLCLIGYKSEVYALSAKCPHAGEDLSRGWCSDGKLVCPVHRFSYSLDTGRGSPGQNDYVDTYTIKIDGADIYIGFESFKEKFLNMFRS